MTRRLLIVGGGPFQTPLIRAANEMGVETVVVDRDRDAPGLAIAHYARVVDTSDKDGVLAVARELSISGVATASSDAAVRAVAEVVSALGLVGLPRETARQCHDKLATYECLSEAGVPTPETRLVDTAEGAREAGASFGYPVVLKPRASAGGRGVTIVRSPSETRAAHAAANASSSLPGVLVQPFIGGTSVGLEAFVRGGVLRAAYLLNDQYRPGFVSPVGHSVPAEFDDDLVRLATDTARAAVSALGITDGPVNMDLRHSDSRFVVLEVNGRLGGNSISELLGHGLGVDLPTATAKVALGDDPGELLVPNRAVPTASRLVLAPRVVGGSTPPRRKPLVSETPGLILLDWFDDQGSPPAIDHYWLLGRCLTTGTTTAEAEDAARAVAENFLTADTYER